MRSRLVALATGAALSGAALIAATGGVNSDYITPPFTFSSDQRYGVMIPVWHDEGAQEPDERMNNVVELATRRIVTVIHAEPGYNRALNFHETAPPLWSADSSVLLWKVKGKWFPGRSRPAEAGRRQREMATRFAESSTTNDSDAHEECCSRKIRGGEGGKCREWICLSGWIYRGCYDR
jgi:hypothetical protein